MGLNIAVRGMQERIGSYSGYDRWRTDISNATGFDRSTTGCGFDMIMDHSDCDGEYKAEFLPMLLEELETVESLNVNTDGITDKMIRLCRYGIEIGEPMIFF